MSLKYMARSSQAQPFLLSLSLTVFGLFPLLAIAIDRTIIRTVLETPMLMH